MQGDQAGKACFCQIYVADSTYWQGLIQMLILLAHQSANSATVREPKFLCDEFSPIRQQAVRGGRRMSTV